MASDTSPVLSSDVTALKSDLTNMRQELAQLKKLAQPMLSQKPSNKWSWADPLDDGAGPGSYNITTEIGKSATLSGFANSPRPVMSRATAPKILPGNQAPAAGFYTPKSDFVLRSDPRFSFCHADVKRLQYVEEIAKRSPGPIYLHGNEQVAGGHISSSKRDTASYFVKNDYPSPQDYTWELPPRKIYGRFDKGKKDGYMKEYNRGMERLLKGREGNFTATLPENPKPGFGLLKCSGHQPLLHQSVSVPGVGTYSIDPVETQRGRFSFPKAKRRLDLKQSEMWGAAKHSLETKARRVI